MPGPSGMAILVHFENGLLLRALPTDYSVGHIQPVYNSLIPCLTDTIETEKGRMQKTRDFQD